MCAILALVTKQVIYGVATTVLLVGLIYALVMDPRPCGMDDISTSCGSGARTSMAMGAVVLSLLLFYVGRAIGNRQT